MHICFLNGHYPNKDGTGGGGAGWYIKMLSQNHVKNGNQVTILKISPNRFIENYIENSGVRVLHYTTSFPFLYYFSKIPFLQYLTRTLGYIKHSWTAYKKILKIDSTNPIDIIEVVDGGNFWLVFFKKFKYIEHLHCSAYTIKKQTMQKIPISHYLERKINLFSSARADAVISPSNAMIKIVEEEQNKKFQIKKMIPLGIEKNKYTAINKTNKVQFIFASRNDPFKGGDSLIKAIRLVNTKINNKVEFQFVGYIPISNNMIPSNIIIKDFLPRKQLLELYNHCDVALLPSLFDNSPLFIYETMAAGLPVIATNVGGIPELIDHGKTGFLFEVNDYKCLADQIITLVNNPHLRIRMGENARKSILQKASIKIIAQHKLSLYNSIIRKNISNQKINEKNNMLVSVIILTYNQFDSVEKTIVNILNQSFDNFELIISDDNSTDGTKEKLLNIAKKNNKIKLHLNKKNVGLAINTRNALLKCTGRYIAFCDGDDYWIDNNKLKIQVSFMENHTNSILTHHKFMTKLGYHSQSNYTSAFVHERIIIPSVMMLRNDSRIINNYKENCVGIISTDLLLVSICKFYGSIDFINFIGTYYNQENDGISKTTDILEWKNNYCFLAYRLIQISPKNKRVDIELLFITSFMNCFENSYFLKKIKLVAQYNTLIITCIINNFHYSLYRIKNLLNAQSIYKITKLK